MHFPDSFSRMLERECHIQEDKGKKRKKKKIKACLLKLHNGFYSKHRN